MILAKLENVEIDYSYYAIQTVSGMRARILTSIEEGARRLLCVRSTR